MAENKYILVVEDDPSTVTLIESILTARGYTVKVVSNGYAALKECVKQAPDLIISDVVMPEMDGYAFYKELKKNPAVMNVPVIILTARTKMADTFSVLGVDEFLTKPFVTEVLLEKVDSLIARGKAASIPVEVNVQPQILTTSSRHQHGVYWIGLFVGMIILVSFFLVRSIINSLSNKDAIKVRQVGESIPLDKVNENQIPKEILNSLELR